MNSDLLNLIILSQKKDGDALAQIINQFHPLIEKLRRKLIYEEAQTDLIIELIKLIYGMNIDKFYNKNEGSLVNYICMAMRNRSIDLFRKNILKNNTSHEINFDILEAQDNSINLINKLFIEEIFESGCLSEKQRLVLIEKYLNENTDVEIADKLKISRQAVNNLKRKALENINRYLDIESKGVG